MNLFKLIEKVALDYANDLTNIRPGNNGPYNHKETILRNSCHWIIIFSRLYQETNNEIYFRAINDLSSCFFSKTARPYGFSFHHRDVFGKDSSNGLIGQAWTFEALYECYLTFNQDKYLKLAEEVFNLHKFDFVNGLWHILDINGQVLDIDAAFNHQLWFAYASSLVIPSENRNFAKIETFLNSLDLNLRLIDKGVVYHPIDRYALPNLLRTNETFLIKTKRILKNLLFQNYRKNFFLGKGEILSRWKKLIFVKSYGYHAFNMLAFVKLEKLIPSHPFWKSENYQKMINVLLDSEFLLRNENNKYSYPYNPTGFETAFVIYEKHIDENMLNLVSDHINIQFRYNFEYDTFRFSKNNNDSETLTARLYELLSLPPEVLRKISLVKNDSHE